MYNYTGLTPLENPDEMRRRYARLEYEYRATWNLEEQARQALIDARMKHETQYTPDSR